MTIQLRPEVQRFAEVMEKQLQLNDHKGGWQDEALSYLSRRLGEEQAELKTAMRDWYRAVQNGDTDALIAAAERVRDEAADVANFAMMVADNVGALKSETP